MPTIHDISIPIHPRMLTWPGDPPVSIRPAKRIANGDSSNVSDLSVGTHTGTHVDPPVHFIDGAPAVDALDLDVLIGPAHLADMGAADSIGPTQLDVINLDPTPTRLLLKTRNSRLWADPAPDFPTDPVAVTPEGAEWLVDHGVTLVGVDFLSVESPGTPGHPTHHRLLEAGMIVVEGLDLREVTSGDYRLICLPLRIEGGDGAPARAVLISD